MGDSPHPLTGREKWILAALAGILLAALALGFILWREAHDARVKADFQELAGKQAQLDAQKKIDALADGIQARDAAAAKAQAAIDARFDKLTTLTQQVAAMAQLAGMKGQPTLVAPGAVPALPAGGALLSPDQVQAVTAYERGCEKCKDENRKLAGDVADLRGQVQQKDVQLAGNADTIKKLNADLKRGFWHKLKECGTRGAVGAFAGSAGAAMSVSGVNQGKPVGRAAAIGGSIGLLSCAISKP